MSTDHNLPQILETLKSLDVLPSTEANPMNDQPNPDSKTEMETQTEVMKERIKAANPDSLISLVLDFLDIENSIKAEYAAANATEKKKLIRWFSMGLIFMFGSMLVSLWALGALGDPVLIDWIFMVKFMAGTLTSLGLGFIVSKVKDEMSIVVKSDKNYLINVIQKATMKLTKLALE